MPIPSREDFPLTLEEVHEAMKRERKAMTKTFLYWLSLQSVLEREVIEEVINHLADADELWWK